MYGMTDRELGLRDGWQLAAADNTADVDRAYGRLHTNNKIDYAGLSAYEQGLLVGIRNFRDGLTFDGK
jgi:hypothetical protein